MVAFFKSWSIESCQMTREVIHSHEIHWNPIFIPYFKPPLNHIKSNITKTRWIPLYNLTINSHPVERRTLQTSCIESAVLPRKPALQSVCWLHGGYQGYYWVPWTLQGFMENQLLMAIFNSYFDITRGYIKQTPSPDPIQKMALPVSDRFCGMLQGLIGFNHRFVLGFIITGWFVVGWMADGWAITNILYLPRISMNRKVWKTMTSWHNGEAWIVYVMLVEEHNMFFLHFEHSNLYNHLNLNSIEMGSGIHVVHAISAPTCTYYVNRYPTHRIHVCYIW